MPIYEYECPKCGHEFEKIQQFSDAPVKRCPQCGGGVRKKLSVSSFQLRGGGWYSDGYSGKGGSSASPDKAKSEKSPAKPESSASKPASS